MIISHLVTVLLSVFTYKKLSLVYLKNISNNMGCVVTFEGLFILHNIGVAHVGENGHLFAGLLPFFTRHLWKQGAEDAVKTDDGGTCSLCNITPVLLLQICRSP